MLFLESALPRPLPSCSNPGTINVEQIRNRYQRNRDETKDTETPADTSRVQQLRNEQRKRSRKTTSQECIRRYSRSCISLEGIDEIVQGTLEDREELDQRVSICFLPRKVWDVLTPMPHITIPMIGAIQGNLGSAVQAKMNSPNVKLMDPSIMGLQLKGEEVSMG